MEKATKTAFPVIGVIFFVLGLVKLLKGDDWVVWLLLGVLFGGLGIFRRGNSGEKAD